MNRTRFQAAGEKTFRLDTTAAVEPPPPDPERVGLLERFRAWVQQRPEDRRGMPRHPAHDSHVWVGWSRGDEAFFVKPARFVDLSRGGALLTAEDPPPEGETVWLWLGAAIPDDCLWATVLEVRSRRRRQCDVRLAFGKPCPHDFFESAIGLLNPPRSRPSHPRRDPV